MNTLIRTFKRNREYGTRFQPLRFGWRGVGRIAVLASVFVTLCSSQTPAETFRIEIDYMVDNDHTHRPGSDVIEAVQQMFACQGHDLIIDVSDALPHYDVLRRDPLNCSASLFGLWALIPPTADTFWAIKTAYADHSSGDGWHYCIFAHRYENEDCQPSGSSGLGERPGWNFVVTLGGWDGHTGTPYEQAATLAHEFGHNLGLTHCGAESCDTFGTYMPNLPSIMSYRYQLNGLRNTMLCQNLTFSEALFKNLDYSHGTMCMLNETGMNEFFGTGMTPVDWDCDGVFEPAVPQDLSDQYDWCSSSGTLSPIIDYNEWASIADPSSSRPGPGDEPEEIACIAFEESRVVREELALRGACPDPVLSTESCLAGNNVYIGQSSIFFWGSCDFPFPYVKMAHDLSPNNSVFILLPGTYNDTNTYGAVRLDKPGKYFCNVGKAVIR